MARILILYSTTDGHTLDICRRIEAVLAKHGHEIRLEAIGSIPPPAAGDVDVLLIGARIRYGRHHPEVYDFIARNRSLLESKPTAFFSVNVVARKPGRDRPGHNPYMRRFLKQIAWRPDALAVFAGKIDYPGYRLFDRMIIRLIMAITGGPTDPHSVTDFTDWQKVEAFAEDIGSLHKAAPDDAR